MARDIKKIDSKGRFFLPSKLKEKMGAVVVATNSFERGYLCVYTEKNFQSIEDQICAFNSMKPAVAKLMRRVIGEAEVVTLDSQGRISISSELWEKIGAKPGDEICVFNIKDKLDICTKEFYDNESSDDDIDMEMLAENYYVEGL